MLLDTCFSILHSYDCIVLSCSVIFVYVAFVILLRKCSDWSPGHEGPVVAKKRMWIFLLWASYASDVFRVSPEVVSQLLTQ